MADGAPNAGDGRQDHATHDEALIAALLDRDPTSLGEGVNPDRARAMELVASCPECGALHRDLLALVQVYREAPVPRRARDFRLTPADAARLRADTAGEPRVAGPRLTGKMHVPTPQHAAHDELLVASLLDRAPGSPDRERAESLVAGCQDCAALHRDLLALREATRVLPTPARPRDFVLSAADIERLQPKGWRRLIAAIGSTGDIFSRPLAIGLTTLGLAGLLVATIPGALPGLSSSTAGPAAQQPVAGGGGTTEPLEASGASKAAELAPSGAPSVGAALAAPPASTAPSEIPAPAASAQPEASGGTYDTFAGATSNGAASEPGSPAAPAGNSHDASRVASTATGSPSDRSAALVLASTGLLVIGLGLFGLRWAARRLGSR